MSSIGSLLSLKIQKVIYDGDCKDMERQTLEINTDEIEQILRPRLERSGWNVTDFDWSGGMWPRLTVSREREVKS